MATAQTAVEFQAPPALALPPNKPPGNCRAQQFQPFGHAFDAALPSSTVFTVERRAGCGGITAAGGIGSSSRSRAVPSVRKAVLRSMGSRRTLHP